MCVLFLERRAENVRVCLERRAPNRGPWPNWLNACRAALTPTIARDACGNSGLTSSAGFSQFPVLYLLYSLLAQPATLWLCVALARDQSRETPAETAIQPSERHTQRTCVCAAYVQLHLHASRSIAWRDVAERQRVLSSESSHVSESSSVCYSLKGECLIGAIGVPWPKLT